MSADIRVDSEEFSDLRYAVRQRMGGTSRTSLSLSRFVDQESPDGTDEHILDGRAPLYARLRRHPCRRRVTRLPAVPAR
ncbi:hypothetical protein FRACA_470040 [Frankia canadensis]|uniref:Uncharacterized protein n=1 Tax=Frankia canadensis TaxID=1836972 RepID=A0A2I2KXV4_9ACTN|nr:hypothetical protein FRACA_470040 [Frankia canadensis]SOU57781.1 hypothetical protein FRACA_470040 [Frankia canadensis]